MPETRIFRFATFGEAVADRLRPLTLHVANICARWVIPALVLTGGLAWLFYAPSRVWGRTNGTTTGDIQVYAPAVPPQLVFACELADAPLQVLFANPEVIPDLKTLHAGVALALPDLSPDRARVVRQLNEAGIPVTAWMLLPEAQGYYLNATNAPEARARFASFQEWTAKFRLHWAAVGLDIEPNKEDFALFAPGHRWQLVSTLFRRLFKVGSVGIARKDYEALIRQIQSSGYSVQTYQFAFIADARRVHSTLLERLFGLVDVRGNDEVLMLYTSFAPNLGSAMIWEYGPDAQTIAVGSTSGVPEAGGKFAPLSWEQFSSDLIVASHFSPRIIGVFSLEGCVQQGFLSRLQTLNWSQPVTLHADAIRKAHRMRNVIQTLLWTGSHLLYFVGVILLAIVALVWRRRSRKRHAQTLAQASKPQP